MAAQVERHQCCQHLLSPIEFMLVSKSLQNLSQDQIANTNQLTVQHTIQTLESTTITYQLAWHQDPRPR